MIDSDRNGMKISSVPSCKEEKEDYGQRNKNRKKEIKIANFSHKIADLRQRIFEFSRIVIELKLFVQPKG